MSFHPELPAVDEAGLARFDLAGVAISSARERRRLQALYFGLSAPLVILGGLLGYISLANGPAVGTKIGFLALMAGCFFTAALLWSLAARFAGVVPTQLLLNSTGMVLGYANGTVRVLKWDADTPFAEVTDARLIPGIRPHNAFGLRPKRSPEIALTKEAYDAILIAARRHDAVLSETSVRIWSGRVVRSVLGGEEIPPPSPSTVSGKV